MSEPGDSIQGRSCPLPHESGETVLLGHGSGGRLSAELIDRVFLASFDSPVLARLDDQAVLPLGDQRVAFSTDSFVVKPLFFPGGDIGSLAVHGTVNDLAVGGARPLWISAAFIIEEGLPIAILERIVRSLQEAAAAAGVEVVTGDTKVVERGSGDQLFINTSGVGLVSEGVELGCHRVRPGDRILISGPMGDHGITIMAQREGLQFETPLQSDSAALHGMVEQLLAATGEVHCLRDLTRGGLSSALNEIARQAAVGMRLDQDAVPVRDEVRGACELLGLDPLYVANEGKLVAFVAPEGADAALAALRAHPLGSQAAEVGEVLADDPGLVLLRTSIGTTRVLDLLTGDQLPRIC
jgi:hydrogenase expression/formation protein HypE